MTDNMTGMQQFYLFLVIGWFILAYLADVYTTETGLAHGFKEGNPLTRWLFSKIGPSATAFLVAGAVLLGVSISSVWAGAYSTYFGAVLAGSETIVALRNFILLKNAKISLK
jgi:hypothetical protein